MGIDISKLENCQKKHNKIIARCPACAEMGQDKKGNHLFISEDGRFWCVVYQGLYGRDHRKRIFQLIRKMPRVNISMDVKHVSQASHEQEKVLMSDVLGQLGHRLYTS